MRLKTATDHHSSPWHRQSATLPCCRSPWPGCPPSGEGCGVAVLRWGWTGSGGARRSPRGAPGVLRGRPDGCRRSGPVRAPERTQPLPARWGLWAERRKHTEDGRLLSTVDDRHQPSVCQCLDGSLLVRSPDPRLLFLSKTPHANCSRRAGCRLAWLTTPSVCECEYEPWWDPLDKSVCSIPWM